MKLFHRTTDQDSPAAVESGTASYDVQADLALPTSGAGGSPEDGFIPYAAQTAPEPPVAGYDVQRDTGVEPA